MKQFFKYFAASTLALIIGGLLLLFIFFGMVGGIIGELDPNKNKEREDVAQFGTILKLELNNQVGEQSFADIDPVDFKLQRTLGLSDILAGLEVAADDNEINGILMNVDQLPAGMASTQEIRDGLEKFKQSGKFLISYSETYSVKGYHLSSVADQVFCYPEGGLEFLGLGTNNLYMKGMMEKLDIDLQIIRGSGNKYKSAIEPLILDSMSVENREQTERYLNSIWNQMLLDISASRGIPVPRLHLLADNAISINLEDAVQEKLLDGLKYEDQIHELLAAKSNIEDVEDVHFKNFSQYVSKKLKKIKKRTKQADKNIAVIYATGQIISGKSSEGSMGSETIVKALRKAKTNENIKAIVLRVNSPGGSALASDVMWREIMLAKAEKPVIVSMGDLAASGGYYIACAGNRIFADENTITGSIGVFGVIPNFENTMKNNFGIGVSSVKTNKHSGLSTLKPLSEEEKLIIQKSVDRIYTVFKSRVAEGRGMQLDQVETIAKGRVWTGVDAIENGLADEIGGIENAIAFAAQEAGVNADDVRLLELPKAKHNPLIEIVEQLEEGNSNDASIARYFRSELKNLESLAKMEGIQARLILTPTIE